MNNVEFEVTGRKALFTFPEFKTGGEKSSMAIPTYEALKGILKSIYWKPTITWIIDEVRVMNPFRMEASGKIIPKMKGNKNDMALYNYLRDCRYQVRAYHAGQAAGGHPRDVPPVRRLVRLYHRLVHLPHRETGRAKAANRAYQANSAARRRQYQPIKQTGIWKKYGRMSRADSPQKRRSPNGNFPRKRCNNERR